MRRPAELEMAGGKGPRQRIWERIRAFGGEPFRLKHLVVGCESKKTARSYLQGLENAGYITRIAGGLGREISWRQVMENDPGIEAPRVRKDGSRVTQGLAQEAMWRTLKIVGDCNARELAAMASTTEIQVCEVAAKDYLQHLYRAGYLTRVKKGRGTGRGGELARYQLTPGKWSGPRPPMICRAKAVFDPNLGKIVWSAIRSEEDILYGM